MLVEEGVIMGGSGSAVLEFAAQNNCTTPVKICGIEDVFINHGTMAELYDKNNLSLQKITENIQQLIKIKA